MVCPFNILFLRQCTSVLLIAFDSFVNNLRGCIRKPLLQCDYCPSYYHLECMDPPMMEPPRTLWMCPLHPIRVIEQKLLKDCRRSSRVKLWRREISLPVNESRVFLDFLRKVRRERAPNSSDDPRDPVVAPSVVPVRKTCCYCLESTRRFSMPFSDYLLWIPRQSLRLIPRKKNCHVTVLVSAPMSNANFTWL